MSLMIKDAKSEDFIQVDHLMRMNFQYHAEYRPDLFYADGSGYGREEFDRLLVDPNHVALIAEVDGVTAGLCLGKVENIFGSPALKAISTGEIEDVAVFPAFRRQGVARALLGEAKVRFAALGARRLCLRVWYFNKGASALYRSFGFETKWQGMEMEL